MLFSQVLEHPDCDKLEAILYGYIYWFTRLKNERCTASNETLAELCRSTVGSIKNALNNLEAAGFISRRYKNDNRFGDREEIIAHLFPSRPSPTDDGKTPNRHPQVTQPSPTGDQNKSIEEEEILHAQARDTIEEEFREIPMNTEDTFSRSPKKPRKVTPEIQAVFDLFTWNPARHTWRLREVEREAARVLYETYDMDTLKKRLAVSQKHRGEEMFPRVDTPSDFLDKMPKLRDFMLKS